MQRIRFLVLVCFLLFVEWMTGESDIWTGKYLEPF